VAPRVGNPLATLRGRLVIAYAGLALVAVALSTLLTIDRAEQEAEARARQALVEEARLAADAVAEPLASQDVRAVRAYLDLADRDLGARIAVADRQVRLVAATDPAPAPLTSQDDEVQAALSGRTVVRDGASDDPVAPVIQVTVPVRSADGQAVGALRAATSLQDERASARRLATAALLGALGVSALAALLGFLLAAPIAEPLQRVAQATLDLGARRPTGSASIPGDRWGAPTGSTPPLPEPRHGTREVKGLVAAFNSLADRLRRQEDARREFAFDVSHELHALAAGMQTATEALLAGAARDEAAGPRLLAGLAGQARRLSRLADDLVELARPEGGRLTIDPVRMDLGELVRGVVEAWAPEADRRGMALGLEAPDGPLPMRGDPVRLAQVLDNLLGNALKYAGGGAAVRVALEPSGSVYDVWVSDTGPGLPPEQLAHIFERHVRAPGPPGAAPGGMGLGLPIARAIARAHGGELMAESEPGRGTRLHLRLPARP
jgi:signal transduction histidine kinase